MSIFIMQYQHNTELPSLVQDDETGARLDSPFPLTGEGDEVKVLYLGPPA